MEYNVSGGDETDEFRVSILVVGFWQKIRKDLAGFHAAMSQILECETRWWWCNIYKQAVMSTKKITIPL
jgi:hypothetical protein